MASFKIADKIDKSLVILTMKKMEKTYIKILEKTNETSPKSWEKFNKRRFAYFLPSMKMF